MNRDLFLAILAMDSYNRGYGAGISGLNVRDTNPDGTPKIVRIGNAAIVDDKGDAAAQAAGFYAISYDLSHAGIEDLDGTVISYRGTDKISLAQDGDILSGWLIGGGAQGGITGGAQAPLSIEFYKAVVGVDDDGNFTSNPFENSITLTGHSLGGGLAAYVASLYGRPAEIFDNMPFELASDITRVRALANEFTGWGYAKDFVYGQYDITDIDRSQISGSFVENEILQILRHLQSTNVNSVESHSDFSSLNLEAVSKGVERLRFL